MRSSTSRNVFAEPTERVVQRQMHALLPVDRCGASAAYAGFKLAQMDQSRARRDISSWQARRLHEAIPHSTSAEIDSGHFVVLERPDKLATVVQNSLHQLTPSNVAAAAWWPASGRSPSD